MSYNTTRIQQQNFLGNEYDISKLFIWNNRFETVAVNNSTYVTETYLAGTLMGRVTATGYCVPLVSTANDGSELPVGVLNQDIVLNAGELANASVCIGGDVAQELILLQGSDTLDTVIQGRRLRDWLTTSGLINRASTDNTYPDNF